jgi:hypothetical protein
MKAKTEFCLYNYLPQYVPHTNPSKDQTCSSSNKTVSTTSLILPISIKILPKKEHHKKRFQQSRIVYSGLSIMQKALKDTYLGTIEEDPSVKIIYNKKDIPLEITNIKDCLATPVNTKQNIFLCKIFIHSNHTLQEYQACKVFTEYLTQENIIIEIYNLDNLNPVQLGFIENIMQRLKL